MKAIGRSAASVLIAVSALGCASMVKVTYHSDPQGASLYANATGQFFGQTPLTLTYKPPQSFRRGSGCFLLQPVRVRWASGAESAVPGVNVCPANGYSQQFVFTRPADAPGRDLDVLTAISAQQAAVAQQEIAAAERAEALRRIGESAEQLGRALGGGSRPNAPSPQLGGSSVAGTVVESRINGTFEGWTGETVFLLQNGQIWQQASYAYHYHYSYSPTVIIYRTSAGFEMKVDGVSPAVRVVRLK